jgi:hypothetical protein
LYAIYRMEKTIRKKNTNRIKIFTLEKLIGQSIIRRERRSSATVAGNEIFESKLKRPNLLVNEEESNQWLRLKTVTPATPNVTTSFSSRHQQGTIMTTTRTP